MTALKLYFTSSLTSLWQWTTRFKSTKFSILICHFSRHGEQLSGGTRMCRRRSRSSSISPGKWENHQWNFAKQQPCHRSWLNYRSHVGPPKMRKLCKKRKHCASATSLWKTLRKPRPQLPRHLQGQSCQLLDIFSIFGFFLRLYTLENDKKLKNVWKLTEFI